MKVLHIAPHLGGGVGKAHAALAEAAFERGDNSGAHHAYVLLEQPRDLAYVDRLNAAGCALHICPEPRQIAALATAADIVQLEWWNHPRLYQALVAHGLPEIRLAAWVHISGLSSPLIPKALLQLVDKTLFTSPCSYGALNLRETILSRPEAFDVVNSGFAFAQAPRRRDRRGGPLRYGYLGTLDFLKLHPQIFDFIDAIEDDIVVRLWGRVEPDSDVIAGAKAMRRPQRIVFEGFTSDPAAVLADLDVLVYLLNPDHYGTAENAIVEAMSLGVVPIVYANPAEAYIVENGKTGFVVDSRAAFAACVKSLGDDPFQLEAMGRAAQAHVAGHRQPERSATILTGVYADLMRQDKKRRDFAAALGSDAQTWFLSSLSSTSDEDLLGSRLLSHVAAKGSLGHFRSCCPQDASLTTFDRLAG